jgi:hypothetical protein
VPNALGWIIGIGLFCYICFAGLDDELTAASVIVVVIIVFLILKKLNRKIDD